MYRVLQGVDAVLEKPDLLSDSSLNLDLFRDAGVVELCLEITHRCRCFPGSFLEIETEPGFLSGVWIGVCYSLNSLAEFFEFLDGHVGIEIDHRGVAKLGRKPLETQELRTNYIKSSRGELDVSSEKFKSTGHYPP